MMGAYEVNITSHDNKVTILASGSEVDLALINSRSIKRKWYFQKLFQFPCHELFDKQSEEYKNQILEKDSLVVALEAGSTSSWHKYLKKDDLAIGIR